MANIALRDTWENQGELADYLARQLNSGSLALFLGAGISQYYGLPAWEGLLRDMFAVHGQPIPDHDLLRSADQYRVRFRKGDEVGFRDDIKAALYRNFKMDFDLLLKNPTLAAIGALVMSSRRGNVSRVVTFNYDDILETYLEYHGFNTISLWNAQHWSSSVDVTVYHPHGYLPFRPNCEPSDRVILDQKSYADIVGDSSNLWYQHIFSILRSHTVLLVGSSAIDPNLDTLLVKSLQAHASRAMPARAQPLYTAVKLTTDRDKYLEESLEERGVFTQHVADYDVALPQFLFSICQRAAALRMN